MKEIIYLKGDATEPIGDGCKIIAHVCNNKGGWGAGFVLALSKKWKEPEIKYKLSISKYKFELGDISTLFVEDDIAVVNMIAQDGYVSENNPVAIRYDALERCFYKILHNIESVLFKESISIHMPRIGCGLAGGSWDKIEPIIKKVFSENDIQVYIYDL